MVVQNSSLSNPDDLNDNEVPRYVDLKVTCCDCDTTFVFTSGEQAYYRDKDLAPPKRCPKCRKWKRFRYAHQELNGDNGNGK